MKSENCWLWIAPSESSVRFICSEEYRTCHYKRSFLCCPICLKSPKTKHSSPCRSIQAIMASWQQEYLAALNDRDALEKANHSIYVACMTLNMSIKFSLLKTTRYKTGRQDSRPRSFKRQQGPIIRSDVESIRSGTRQRQGSARRRADLRS